ncbi:MAG: hypothetical protein J6S85_03785 [Methanobrevibacter sp.]|nr:hypothetical protein [Methanobrevibacter sp.]
MKKIFKGFLFCFLVLFIEYVLLCAIITPEKDADGNYHSVGYILGFED